MKKPLATFLILLLFCAFYWHVPAQQPAASPQDQLPDPYSILQRGLEDNNYLAPLLEYKRREAQYTASDKWRDAFLTHAGYLYSYVGEYNTAYSYMDRQIEAARDTSNFKNSLAPLLKIPEKPALSQYKPLDAIEVINSLADAHPVIMINEEHDTPMHRAFTARLLPVLYAKGFRYLAAETLSDADKELNTRGYPTHETGFYSEDPVFGEMLRSALKLGFKLVPYEHRSKERCTSPPDNRTHCQNERERGQAQNLYDRILRDDPQARVLVHVGRGHNQKRKFEQWAKMAWHFREISKIDPLSINQMMSERSQPTYEMGLYRYVTEKWRFSEPVAFQSKSGEYWHGYYPLPEETKDRVAFQSKSQEYRHESGFDVEIFHPRTRYEQGRPAWLRMGGARKPYNVYQKNRTLRRLLSAAPVGTYLIQAFVVGESPAAIPVDQVVTTNLKQSPVLLLGKGKFRIRVVDEFGKIIVAQEVSP